MFTRKTTATLAGTALAAVLAVLAVGPSAHAATLPISTCGQVVTTSVVLTKDLTCVGTPGVVVGAGGITIDLKGHVLTGDYSDMGVRDLSGYGDVTIKNGVIRNFLDGVLVPNTADHVTVSNLVVSGNSGNGVYVQGAAAKVVSSTVAGNGQTGISLRDHRAQMLIRDATLYREQQARAKLVRQTPAPPVQKPGVARSAASVNETEIKNLTKELSTAKGRRSLEIATKLQQLKRSG